jgi:hypothetical protein
VRRDIAFGPLTGRCCCGEAAIVLVTVLTAATVLVTVLTAATVLVTVLTAATVLVTILTAAPILVTVLTAATMHAQPAKIRGSTSSYVA